jgi:hypothetical protein
MTHFKIISVGGDCLPFIERTFKSIEKQTYVDYEVWVVDDAPQDRREAQYVTDFLASHDRFNGWVTSEKRWQVRNQVEAIRAANPGPEDVLVWLDMDGDQLASEDTLEKLVSYYETGTLLTYGSYTPIPDPGTCAPTHDIPRLVIQKNSLRSWILEGHCPFNHLRTMKAKVFKQIPDAYFKWPDGRYYEAGADYCIMTAGLELVGENFTWIKEVLCLYNHDNPRADYLSRARISTECTQHMLRHQKPLTPIEEWL